MIGILDDYCVHQTPDYMAIPGTTDRNFYDRYYFIGYDRDGTFMFGIAFGRYPNRFVKDAHFTFSDGRRQVSMHASDAASISDARAVVGQLTIDVVRPMRELRCRSEPCDGVSYDLTFLAETGAIDEGRLAVKHDGITTIDQTRFMQYGRWRGWIQIADRRYEVRPLDVYGLRDKSWGIRLFAEHHTTLRRGGQIFWMNVVMRLQGQLCVVRTLNDRAGASVERGGYFAPVYGSPEEAPIQETTFCGRVSDWTFDLRFQPGTRRVIGGTYKLSLDEGQERSREFRAEIGMSLWYAGMGYNHARWNHGLDHGGSTVTEREDWTVADIDLGDPDRQFLASYIRVFDREGPIGFGHTEQLLMGPYDPLGWGDGVSIGGDRSQPTPRET